MPEEPEKESEITDEPYEEKESEDVAWEKDQKRRGYYYDDAHGYEEYKPGDDQDDED